MGWFDRDKNKKKRNAKDSGEDMWPDNGTLPPAPVLTWNLANKRTFAQSVTRNRQLVTYFYDAEVRISGRLITVRFDIETISIWDGSSMILNKSTKEITERDIEKAVTYLFQR